jgi:hypothetical protein
MWLMRLRRKDKIDLIFQRIIQVNSLVNMTTNASKEQSNVMENATAMLGDVVEIVNSTIQSVEQTLDLMELQRKQVVRLTDINQNLDSTSKHLLSYMVLFDPLACKARAESHPILCLCRNYSLGLFGMLSFLL